MRSRKSDSDEIELAMSNKSFVISHRNTKRTGNKTRPRIVFAKFFFSSGQLVKLHKNQFTPEKSNLQACLAGFSSRLASRTSPKSLRNWDFRDEVKKRLKSALNARPLVRRLFTPEIKILLHCRWNTNFLCVHERRRKRSAESESENVFHTWDGMNGIVQQVGNRFSRWKHLFGAPKVEASLPF